MNTTAHHNLQDGDNIHIVPTIGGTAAAVVDGRRDGAAGRRATPSDTATTTVVAIAIAVGAGPAPDRGDDERRDAPHARLVAGRSRPRHGSTAMRRGL